MMRSQLQDGGVVGDLCRIVHDARGDSVDGVGRPRAYPCAAAFSRTLWPGAGVEDESPYRTSMRMIVYAWSS